MKQILSVCALCFFLIASAAWASTSIGGGGWIGKQNIAEGATEFHAIVVVLTDESIIAQAVLPDAVVVNGVLNPRPGGYNVTFNVEGLHVTAAGQPVTINVYRASDSSFLASSTETARTVSTGFQFP